MTEASERTMLLLEELALLKKCDSAESHVDAAERSKRRKEISEELKQIATEKTQDSA